MEGKKAEASTEALPGEASPLPECERQGESCRSSEAPSVTASAEVLPLITAVVSASEEKERFCDSENNASLASAAPGCPACATYKDEDMAAWISLPNYIEASDRVMKDVKTPDVNSFFFLTQHPFIYIVFNVCVCVRVCVTCSGEDFPKMFYM